MGVELELVIIFGIEKENGWIRLLKRMRIERGEDGGKLWMR